MVSLGPLSPKRYCTYDCPFCYVNSGFQPYASLSIPEIVAWLRAASEPFDIIYVSGDTDSFAPPRTAQGVALIEALSEFDVDLLFTTRAIIPDEGLVTLRAVQQKLASKNRMLIGCVSVAQWTVPHLEPKPIPPSMKRLEQLRRFKELGLVSVLAMRPFLPNVPHSDYITILDNCHSFVDIVLGEVWYVDSGLELLRKTIKDSDVHPVALTPHSMDFDANEEEWLVYEATEIQSLVVSHAKRLGLHFSMRSAPAIRWLRDNGRGAQSRRDPDATLEPGDKAK